jgi:hypothetical protein
VADTKERRSKSRKSAVSCVVTGPFRSFVCKFINSRGATASIEQKGVYVFRVRVLLGKYATGASPALQRLPVYLMHAPATFVCSLSRCEDERAAGKEKKRLRLTRAPDLLNEPRGNERARRRKHRGREIIET